MAQTPLWSALWAHTHQLVRDLCWLLYAPPFWPWYATSPDQAGADQDTDDVANHRANRHLSTSPSPCTHPFTYPFTHPLWPASHNQHVLAWIQTLAQHPAPLVEAVHAALAPKRVRVDNALHNPPRLGRLAEALMDYQLRHNPAMRWEASGVKLFTTDGNGTAVQLGELDYLWRDAQAALVHAELAVKFYALAYHADLHSGMGQQAALQAIGPDGHENWQHKLHKLLHKQLVHSLPQPWANEPVQRVAHVRGRWFVPVRSAQALNTWASLPNAQPKDWADLLGRGPWSQTSHGALPSPLPTADAATTAAPVTDVVPIFRHNTARFGPRLSWWQARNLVLPAQWQCRVLQRVEWLGPVSQANEQGLHAPSQLSPPGLPPSGHPRVHMLGVFAFDDSAGAWCEQWRAWLDAEAGG